MKIKELKECELEIETFKQRCFLISQDIIIASDIELIMQQLTDLKRRQSECQEYIAKAKIINFNNDNLNHVCPLSMINASFKGESVNKKIGVTDGVSLDSAFGRRYCVRKWRRFLFRGPCGYNNISHRVNISYMFLGYVKES